MGLAERLSPSRFLRQSYSPVVGWQAALVRKGPFPPPRRAPEPVTVFPGFRRPETQARNQRQETPSALRVVERAPSPVDPAPAIGHDSLGSIAPEWRQSRG